MSRPIRGQGSQIGSKYTNVAEDVEILLPAKFHQIPFSNLREEVENVLANQRLGWQSWFSDQPSCESSFNFIQQLQRRSRKTEKLMRTDRQQTVCDHNSALEPKVH